MDRVTQSTIIFISLYYETQNAIVSIYFVYMNGTHIFVMYEMMRNLFLFDWPSSALNSPLYRPIEMCFIFIRSSENEVK